MKIKEKKIKPLRERKKDIAKNCESGNHVFKVDETDEGTYVCIHCLQTKPRKLCEVCMGYGWHPLGELCPIGPMDASEWGRNVIKCPWCNKGFDTENERYKRLLKMKMNYDDEQNKKK